MSAIEIKKNRRILIVDDNEAIHLDFHKILAEESGGPALDRDEFLLFGESVPAASIEPYTLDSAYQGEQALRMIQAAFREGNPYAVAFVDVRMPPGWDGVETIEHLWEEDPALQVVICTAYSDYSWDEIVERLGITDRLLILKKPFDRIQVRQLAVALTEKWHLACESRRKRYELEQHGQATVALVRPEYGAHPEMEDCLTGVRDTAAELMKLVRELREIKKGGGTEPCAVDATAGEAIPEQDGLDRPIDATELVPTEQTTSTMSETRHAQS